MLDFLVGPDEDNFLLLVLEQLVEPRRQIGFPDRPRVEVQRLVPGDRDDRLPLIVFITAYDQYALRAFEACAVDYILKPFDRARFERAIEQAKSRIRKERRVDLTQHLLTLLENLKRPPAYPERMAIKDSGEIIGLF